MRQMVTRCGWLTAERNLAATGSAGAVVKRLNDVVTLPFCLFRISPTGPIGTGPRIPKTSALRTRLTTAQWKSTGSMQLSIAIPRNSLTCSRLKKSWSRWAGDNQSPLAWHIHRGGRAQWVRFVLLFRALVVRADDPNPSRCSGGGTVRRACAGPAGATIAFASGPGGRLGLGGGPRHHRQRGRCGHHAGGGQLGARLRRVCAGFATATPPAGTVSATVTISGAGGGGGGTNSGSGGTGGSRRPGHAPSGHHPQHGCVSRREDRAGRRGRRRDRYPVVLDQERPRCCRGLRHRWLGRKRDVRVSRRSTVMSSAGAGRRRLGPLPGNGPAAPQRWSWPVAAVAAAPGGTARVRPSPGGGGRTERRHGDRQLRPGLAAPATAATEPAVAGFIQCRRLQAEAATTGAAAPARTPPTARVEVTGATVRGVRPEPAAAVAVVATPVVAAAAVTAAPAASDAGGGGGGGSSAVNGTYASSTSYAGAGRPGGNEATGGLAADRHTHLERRQPFGDQPGSPVQRVG